ncbi:DUF2490 domain-containing protein [Flagellimonas crocea]|uniref:DUF2490 domain-containing protein n=1 Tax=Flagellimonas crocea TaxID=3067311 RepID=UPI00296E3DB5|nr:DUF2490 domain-containing protein [Muricauda sp. DH64]
MGFTKYLLGLLCSLAFIVLIHFPSYGQNSEENEYGSWLVLCGNVKVHEDWSVPAVGILRHHHMVDTYGFFFLRTGASYHVSKTATLTGGFALINSNSYLEPNDVINTNQVWMYGEFDFKSEFNKNFIAQRIRFENRRLVHTEDPKVNNRIRYRLQYVRPIYKGMYFKAFDEAFLNLEGKTFSENRIFVGFGRKLTPTLKADIGYFNRRFRDYGENMVRLSFYFDIDLTKKDLSLKSNQVLPY